WLNRKPTKSERRLNHLIDLIQHAYHEHKGIYGYRRMTIFLNHFLNAKVNHKCVYRLMQLLELKAVIRRRSEEHTSELQSRFDIVCRLLLEKKKNNQSTSLSPIVIVAM